MHVIYIIPGPMSRTALGSAEVERRGSRLQSWAAPGSARHASVAREAFSAAHSPSTEAIGFSVKRQARIETAPPRARCELGIGSTVRASASPTGPRPIGPRSPTGSLGRCIRWFPTRWFVRWWSPTQSFAHRSCPIRWFARSSSPTRWFARRSSPTRSFARRSSPTRSFAHRGHR